jgi:putative ABC transport system ATP-binding protein
MNLMRKNWKWLVLLAVAVAVVLRMKLAATPVVAHVVQKANVVAEVMGTGTLEARVKTTLSPRIQERLAEVLVDQGDFVVAGQLLARLDDGELKRQVEVSEAALANVLANQPSLILADEPTAALDSHRGRQVMELFRKVAHERGSAVIVVTHDHRSLDVFDRTYEMEDGLLRNGGSERLNPGLV